MTLIVQKFGGTSVGNVERIHHVADKVVKSRSEGHQLVIVVSAMSGETDRLVSLAQQFSDCPDPREVDVLLSTGEQVSIALLSMALIARGCPARSYTGPQVHIRTDQVHNKARIIAIDSQKIHKDLSQGKVVVVAGFQGVDGFGNITTLGRGGSDTTAVALAAALKADECQIFTDVEGVYTADPHMVPDAKRMSHITFEEMLEFSSLGAKVMQIRAVEFAGKYNVPIRVLSTFEEGPGTLIAKQILNSEQDLSKTSVSGIACTRDEAKLVIQDIPNEAGIDASVLGPISDAHIEVDIILHNFHEGGKTDLTFTVHRRDYQQALSLLTRIASEIGASRVVGNDSVAKLSLVGMGVRSETGVTRKLLQILGEEGINIQLMSTSEIKVSVVIDEKDLEKGARALHKAFELGSESYSKLEQQLEQKFEQNLGLENMLKEGHEKEGL